MGGHRIDRFVSGASTDKIADGAHRRHAMGTRNDKTTAGVRVGRGSQGCFKTISRDSLRSHGPERGAVVRRGFLSRHASGLRDLNRPEGLRSRETALKEIASETAPT